ncbi:hypothetical protein [Sphingobium sp.]|uniref:hypothetical protein n=1 Tax=Sphingobium sp. TaxID=1912891 RepID=UPI002BFBDFFE|nr:hypothetical protein [Sphingobium sp.]HUD91057.1 hypothetical protein [Sphingobium sp.]
MDTFKHVIEQEITPLKSAPSLTWGAFKDAWFHITRRVVLGDGASDDKALSAMLLKLRGDANWILPKA